MDMELEDFLLIAGISSLYNEDSEYYRKPKVDLEDWSYISTDLLDYDLEDGWSREDIVIYQKSTDKYYVTELIFISQEGYTEEENGKEIVLFEVEPYEVSVTKFQLKNELHSQNSQEDLGGVVPTSHTQTTEISD